MIESKKMAGEERSTESRLIAFGVYLGCVGIFAILLLLVLAARDLPMRPLWLVLTGLCGFFSISMLIVFGVLIFVSGHGRGIYNEFIAEDPTRRDLPDAEFRRQFERWSSDREV